MAAVSAAAVGAAVAIPLTLAGSSQPFISIPAPPPPALSYMVTVHGQAWAVPATGAAQLFTVAPGERLTMTVEVTVPGPQAMTALWLGISNGVLSGHADMEPVLAASTGAPLRPGAHRFVLHWTVPAGLAPGSSRQLSVEWEWRGPEPGNAQRDVAYFAVPLPSTATTPATVARQIRAKALHAVTSCDGSGPAWIRAVRTTFSQAMTVVGRGNSMGENARAAVYLVLMKGDFAFRGSGPRAQSCARAGPPGHYYTVVFDASTFVTLEASLGARPPQVSLNTVGPMLNLKHTKR
jgi:hypothetical protein